MFRLFKTVTHAEPLLSQTVIRTTFLVTAVGICLYSGRLSWHLAQCCVLSSLFLFPQLHNMYMYVHVTPILDHLGNSSEFKNLHLLLGGNISQDSSIGLGPGCRGCNFSPLKSMDCKYSAWLGGSLFKHFSVKIYPPCSSGIFSCKWNCLNFHSSLHCSGSYANGSGSWLQILRWSRV